MRRKLRLQLHSSRDAAVSHTTAHAISTHDSLCRFSSTAQEDQRLVRTFIAVVPPPSLVEKIYSETSSLRLTSDPSPATPGTPATPALPPAQPRLRWVRANNFHLTLNFLGAIESTRIDLIKQTLEQAVADIRPFEVEMSRIGVFPSWNAPRVLHVETNKGREELATLSRRVWDSLRVARMNEEEAQRAQLQSNRDTLTDTDPPHLEEEVDIEVDETANAHTRGKRKREQLSSEDQTEKGNATDRAASGNSGDRASAEQPLVNRWPEEPRRQEFVPHLTLARWQNERGNGRGRDRRKSRRQPVQLSEEDERIRALAHTWQERLSFEVSEIYLMESVLPAPGAQGEDREVRYVPLHIQPLAAPVNL